MKKFYSGLLALVAVTALFATGCDSSSPTDPVINPAGAQNAGLDRVIVERLARPGINEALLITNAFLNALNSVTPAFEAAALADPNSPQGQAAAPIFAEALFVLQLLTALDPDPVNGFNLTPAAAVGAFLPDVMRVDLTNNVTLPDTAYAFELNNVGSPVSGRKLTDDVVDITLTVLTDGAVTMDNVPYYANPKTNFIGHQNLNGQNAPFGAATFPYLAPAN